MKQIEEHIEKLLCSHHFLAIPGLGGLVTQAKPALCERTDEGHHLSPPSCEVNFNSSIQYNDGLLLESYMQTYSLCAGEAEGRLKTDVAQLHKRLNRGETITVGTIGIFEKEATGNLRFTSIDSGHLNSRYYGLGAISIPHLANEERNSVDSDNMNDLITLSFSKRKLYRVASIAACAVVLIGLAIPISITQLNVTEASLVPAIGKTVVTPISSETFAIDEAQLPEPTLQPAATEITTKKTIGIEKTYYIVVAGGVSNAEAKKRASALEAEGYVNCGVVSREDKVRVYIDHYDNRAAAEASLSSYRTEKGFTEAWLLILK